MAFIRCVHENEPKQLATFDCRALRNHPFIQVVSVGVGGAGGGGGGDLVKKTTPVDYGTAYHYYLNLFLLFYLF